GWVEIERHDRVEDEPALRTIHHEFRTPRLRGRLPPRVEPSGVQTRQQRSGRLHARTGRWLARRCLPKPESGDQPFAPGLLEGDRSALYPTRGQRQGATRRGGPDPNHGVVQVEDRGYSRAAVSSDGLLTASAAACGALLFGSRKKRAGPLPVSGLRTGDVPLVGR